MDDYLAARSRPIGISILSVLAVIGGVGLVIVMVVAGLAFRSDSARFREASVAMAELGIPIPLIVAGVIFLTVLAFASGIGMWRGTKWGWYIGSFWYAYAIVRNINALVAVHNLAQSMPPQEMASMKPSPESYYIKYFGRLVISLLIYLYFFKANVREYFGLTSTSRWKAVAAEFGICVGIVILVSVVSLALQ